MPLLVKLPGQARAGTRVGWQVRTLDIAPTIAEAANVAASPRWRGMPLFADDFDRMLALGLPPAPDGSADPGWTPPTWANHPASREAVSELDFDGYDLASLRTGGRKLVEARRVAAGSARELPPVALYDLLGDPGESTNLADGSTEASLRAWLGRKLEEARSEAVVPKNAAH